MNSKKRLKHLQKSLKKQRAQEIFNEIEEKGIVRFNKELNKTQDVEGFFDRAVR